MKVYGMPFDEKRIHLYAPDSKAEIMRYSPAGKVPVLHDEGTVVWDSLAILEHLAERQPRLWPRASAYSSWVLGCRNTGKSLPTGL